MKKYFTRLLTLAVIAPALVSCAEQLPDFGPQAKKHTVYFSTAEEATRTGLSIDDGIVTPDWRDTDVDDVHVFEMDGTHDGVMGQTTDLSMDEEYLAANFKVDFEEDMTIYVETPPSPTLPADGTRASGSVTRASGSGYTYGAVVAKMKESEEEPVFYIDATQKPDPNTLKDPGAEFLIGFSRDAYDAAPDGESIFVDLYFDRVAALSRIGFSEFQGTNEKVMSVKINSETSMTGSASFNDITFGNTNTVSFTPDEGSGILTLDYGEGVSVTAEETFYAYFVSMPGTFKITSIEILTDQYSYTKVINKDVVFTITELKNLKLTGATAVKISSNVWYKASVLEGGYDYLIVSGVQALKNNDGATAAVAVTPEDGILSFESATDPTIIWRATAHTENTGDNGQGGIIAGHFTLTNDGMYLLRNSQKIELGDAIPSAKPKYAVWDYDGTYLKQESSETQTQYCYYDNGWATGYTQNGTAPTSSIKTVEIFTNRPPQGIISFEAETYSKVLEEGTFTIEVQGEHIGDVKYSSSNTEIATVNEDTGEVTPVKSGTVKIIATAAGSDTYQAAVAKYELTITSNSVTTWYKAEDVEDNGVYMIVSNGYALKLNSSNGLDAVSDEAFTGEASFQYEADESMKWTAGASAEKFTFKSGSRYLSRNTSNAPATSSGTSYSWSYDGINNHLSNVSSNNTTYYLYVSGNGNKWALSTDGTGTHTSTLYTTTAPLPAWEMSFSNETVEYDLATHTWTPAEPTLTTNAPTVTYESSDQEVASVTATGVVDPLKRGTTIITATAVADATHKKTEASYQLKVIDSSIPTKTYRKVTSTADLEFGTQYLLVYEDGSKVFKPILTSPSRNPYFSAETGNALDVSIDANTITSSEFEECEMTLEEGYYFYVASSEYYLYPTNTSYNAGCIAAEKTKTDSHKFSISIANNGIVTINRTSNNSTYSLCYSEYFRGSSSVAANVALYKLDDGRQEQTLRFSPATASYDLYAPTSFVKPTLSNAHGDVTYSTSDATIAEVDNSGNITGKKVGTVTITATAAGDTQYKPGSASYELTVEDSSPAKEYVRVESAADLEVGAKYLIVYESGSFAFKPYLASGSTTAFAKEKDNKQAVSISNHKIVSNDLDEWQITLEEGYYLFVESVNKYLYPASSSGTALNAESPKSHIITISVNNGIASLGNNNQYIYYSTNSEWFSSTGTAANVNTSLYKLDDGRQPQSISFSKSSAEYDLGTSSWTDEKPSIDLTGVHTTVTYESSDPTVATVTNDGEVTPLKKGTTKIVATAAASDTYKSATAEYTLTVKNSTLSVEYYTKVNSRDGLPGTSQTSATGNYIFVYEDGNKAYVFKAICDGTPTGAGNTSTGHVELTKEGSAIEVTLTDNGIEATDAVKACQLQLAHHSTASRNDWNIKPVSLGTYWIRVNNDGSSVRILAMTSAGYSGTFTFDGSGNNLEVKRTDSNRNAYWSYNATNNCFEATSTASKISVYQLSE
jgi:Bacterial Ig-like domain (group 2).